MYREYSDEHVREIVDMANIMLECQFRPKSPHVVVDDGEDMYSSVHGKMKRVIPETLHHFADKTISIKGKQESRFNTSTKIGCYTPSEDVLHICIFGYEFTPETKQFSWEPLFVFEINNRNNEVHSIVRDDQLGYFDFDKFNLNRDKDHKEIILRDRLMETIKEDTCLEGFDVVVDMEFFEGDTFNKLLSRLILDKDNKKARPLSKNEETAICKKHLQKTGDGELAIRIVESTLWYGKLYHEADIEAVDRALLENGMEDLLINGFKHPSHKHLEVFLSGETIEDITGVEDRDFLEKLKSCELYAKLPDIVSGVRMIYKRVKDKEKIIKMIESYRKIIADYNFVTGKENNHLLNDQFTMMVKTALTFEEKGIELDKIIA